MVFAFEEINGNPDILPNITLGFWIYDSCAVVQQAIEGILWQLSGQKAPVPNYECWRSRPPTAIIGDAISTSSMLMAHILGLYRYPQISYSASSALLSNRKQFPSFFRTIPSDDFQSRGLAQLLMHFGWTWVGLLADDDDYGQLGIRLLHQEIVKAGACVAFSETITSVVNSNAFHIVQVIKKSTANVIVIFSNRAFLVLDEMVRQNVTGKLCLATEGWSTSPTLSDEKYSEVLIGAIGFDIYNREMPGFKEYLTSFCTSNSSDHGHFQKFLEEVFDGQRMDLEIQKNVQEVCSTLSGASKASEPPKLSGVTSFGLPYNIYTAVYATALSLVDLGSCRSGGGPFYHGSCADITDHQPWQLLHYINNVQFPERFGRGKFFDEHGNPPARYDIVNWQRSLKGIITPVKVGTYDSSAPNGQPLIINSSAIQWNAGDLKPPVSVCSPSCLPGFRKVAEEGQPVCCFKCVQCPQEEISNQTDSIECLKCPLDQWPNEKKDCCVQKLIEFLYYEEPLGAMLTATSILFSFLPVAILGLFLLHRKTPIVRANNRSISYLLLLSLTLCYLCSLAFIGYPSPEKCLLRQVAFGVIFALCVSCILAKTIIVVIAFNATKPNSSLRRWVGPHLSYTLIGVCTLIQVILCLSWLNVSPPFPEHNILSKPGVLILECNEGSFIAFWCMLGYLGLLATASFIVAFIARKLPDSFNEAQFITFSMLAFLCVWLSFIPAYLSTKGKYMVAMEVFAILSASSSLVFCIFLPKCFIIVFRSDINSKEYLMGRGAAQKKKS
ncbi:extracellular calcium-sensing receptor-like [Lissotriton helveticus]